VFKQVAVVVQGVVVLAVRTLPSSVPCLYELGEAQVPCLKIEGYNCIVRSLELMNNFCAEGISETVEETFVLPTGTAAMDVTVRKDAARVVCMILTRTEV
jgi:hypothetical protein